ncbi:hypothetical protein C4L39_26300, partial [Clostridium diolis]|uniref:hypothetical protein n=1 Tax=Clostridium diolis TaxID=223919 RepID=UPI000D29CBFD
NLDWMDRFSIPAPEGQASGTSYDLVLDGVHLSKARRKLGAERGILISFEADGVGASFGADVRILMRET